MTAQAREILILEGNNTSMNCCPPLPKNSPHITRSPKTIISSCCWRGYIGTWEIKKGQLFLIGLSGNYRLSEGKSIFAEWFSGEIIVPEGDALKCDAMGSPYLYEGQQNIKVENGIVVATSMIDNTPAPPDASEIRKFVESRGITSLLHFTKVKNVPGILAHGLLARQIIASRELKAEFNDQYRYDNAADAVCASISFPNYKMFYSLQQKNSDEDWAVLRLNPKILWEIPCAYCISNAASSEVTSIPIKERMGLKALKSMFEDIPPSIKRANLSIPDEYTTDPQAEILILGPINPDYIVSINFNGRDKIKDMATMKRLFQPYTSNFKFLHDESLFTYRKDYDHWRRDQLSTVDISIDFDDIFNISN
jgi:hypothetical protein